MFLPGGWLLCVVSGICITNQAAEGLGEVLGCVSSHQHHSTSKNVSVKIMKKNFKNPLTVSLWNMKLTLKELHLQDFNLVIKNIYNFMKQLFKYSSFPITHHCKVGFFSYISKCATT